MIQKLELNDQPQNSDENLNLLVMVLPKTRYHLDEQMCTNRDNPSQFQHIVRL